MRGRGRIIMSLAFCFNTDNGIRRATIIALCCLFLLVFLVSIPTTVSGGLQCRYHQEVLLQKDLSFQYRQRYQEGYNALVVCLIPMLLQVSIPTTVSGGLQFYVRCWSL